MYYIFCLAANSSSLLRQYCENTIPTALPDADIEIIALLYPVTIAGLCWMGAEAMTRMIYPSVFRYWDFLLRLVDTDDKIKNKLF